MTQLYVIPEKCIACGKCFLNFPEVFDCNDEGIAFVKKEALCQMVWVTEFLVVQHNCVERLFFSN